jgi:O-antigen/teichoic acid export membrane protein
VSELRKQGIRAFFWDLLGKLLTNGTGFVITILLARLLTPAEFGQVAMVMVLVGMASIFTDMGLSSALIQRQEPRSVHYSTVFYVNLAAGLALGVITYLSADWIGEFYGQPELIPLAKVLALLFIFDSFASTQTTILRKQLNYKVLARARFLSSAVSGLPAVLMALYGWGVWSLVVQALCASLLYSVLIWAWSRWRPRLEFSIEALRELWGFGFRMFLAGLLDAVVTRIDYLVIGKLFAPATLGIYQRAKSLNNMVTQYASGSLMAVMFPLLSNVQTDVPRIRNIVKNTLCLICFVAFLLLGLLYLNANELILLLFGEKWRASGEFLQILVISGFAYPIGALMVNVLRSRGQSQRYLRLEVLKKVFVLANLGILYLFGIETYLYGLILVASIGLALNVHYAAAELEMPAVDFATPIIWQLAVVIVAVVVSQIACAGLDESWLLLSIVAKSTSFVFAYFLMSYLLKTDPFKEFARRVNFQVPRRS